MTMPHLAYPLVLILLVLVPLPWLFQRFRPRLDWPTLAWFSRGRFVGVRWLAFLPVLLRSTAVAALVVALARPQSVGGRTWIAAAWGVDRCGAGP